MKGGSYNAKKIVSGSKMEYSSLNTNLHSNKQSNLLKYKDTTTFAPFLANPDIC